MTIPITVVRYIAFEPVPVGTPTPIAGQSGLYVVQEGGVEFLEYVEELGFRARIMRDRFLAVRNDTGSTIAKGAAVYINGFNATPNQPTVALAKADAVGTMPCDGLAAEAILTGTSGRIISDGRLDGVVTTGMTVGDRLYVSKATAGAFTNVRPALPVFEQRVGKVMVVGASGSVFVGVTEMDEKNQVNGLAPLDENGIPWDPGTKVVTADIVRSSTQTTFADVTGLTGFAVIASGKYTIEGCLWVSSAATTTGIGVTLTGPASPTSIRFGAIIPRTVQLADFRSAAAFADATVIATDNTTTPSMIMLGGELDNGSNAGNVAIQTKADALANYTIHRGSWLRLRRIG